MKFFKTYREVLESDFSALYVVLFFKGEHRECFSDIDSHYSELSFTCRSVSHQLCKSLLLFFSAKLVLNTYVNTAHLCIARL